MEFSGGVGGGGGGGGGGWGITNLVRIQPIIWTQYRITNSCLDPIEANGIFPPKETKCLNYLLPAKGLCYRTTNFFCFDLIRYFW